MSWQYQPSYEHSNPLEQTFPTFMTSFDRILEEMQNLNKSMEARLVKMDERMINWGGSTSIMDNMSKGTEIPRQEVSEQCKENPSMPRQHARAGVTSYMWAGVATSSNATTTSQNATKSDASANSTESDAENDTITLMLKHEPIIALTHSSQKHPALAAQKQLALAAQTESALAAQTEYALAAQKQPALAAQKQYALAAQKQSALAAHKNSAVTAQKASALAAN
ncbi:hypothetical protein V6N13_126479 [Hibiscus sabdariffa]